MKSSHRVRRDRNGKVVTTEGGVSGIGRADKAGRMRLPPTLRQIMKRLFLAVILLLALPVSSLPDTYPCAGTVDVYFSPRGGATAAVIREIDAARSEILIQAYSFTSSPIAKALLAAKKRGVRIEAVLDKSNATARYSAATFLANGGATVLIDSAHAIAHNKIIIIDRRTLITGSFNFTKAAEEKNAENLLVFHGNEALSRRYLQNYLEHREHSLPYSRR